MKDPIRLTFEQWVSTYKPRTNTHVNDAPHNGYVFEASGEELVTVTKANVTHVWTLIEDDDATFIVTGMHYVNRLGYFITDKPWEHDNISVLLESNPE